MTLCDVLEITLHCEPCEPSGYPIRIPIPRIQQRSIPRTIGPGRSWSGKSSCRFPLYDWPWPERTPHVTPARGPDWPARCSSSQLVSVLGHSRTVMDSDQYGHLESQRLL